MTEKLSEIELTDLRVALNAKNSISTANEELNKNLKDTLLRFYLTFNIFESLFYNKPQWVEEHQGKKTRTISNKKRREKIQSFCNKHDYPLKPSAGNHSNDGTFINVISLQEHFREVYLIKKGSWIWTERGESLKQSKYNPGGLSPSSLDKLKSFLLCEVTEKENKQKSIEDALFLCYFFRNNLFHGTKEINKLNNYEKDFKKIEAFMTGLMRYLAANNAPKF
ncbi:MAG: hypothetical protein MJ250_08845 [Alphaproteobacteria bacterium]|nr:hypothetical protein [Alphaproteobacteria bacterium]